MPFKSEKQRRYLWANEPEIARDWTDTYGSRIHKYDGGIARIGLKMGGNPWSWLFRILPHLKQEEDDDDLNWFQNQAQNITGGIGNLFTYRPATQGAYGHTPMQLNRMNALGGWYSEPARARRRWEKRQTNVLNRAAANKPVGNVNKLLGQHGYQSTPGGGLQFTGRHEGNPSAGAGYSRSDSGWQSSPFNKGGLATLWRG
jgi:hypothetical protein